MTYPVRLKTGFYETADYAMSVLPGAIMLSPMDDTAREAIQIMKDDITVITLTLKKRSGLEIQTHEKTFVFVLQENTDNDEMRRQFREAIGKKIVFEEL